MKKFFFLAAMATGCHEMGTGQNPCKELVVDSGRGDSGKNTQESGDPDSGDSGNDSVINESNITDSGKDSEKPYDPEDKDGDGHAVNDPYEADCDDTDPTIYPGAEENCSNWKDDDCDGTIDGTNVWPDADRDGFGNETAEQMAVCGEGEEGYVTNNLDCNDANSDVNPNEAEVVGDNVDNNCDGTIK